MHMTKQCHSINTKCFVKYTRFYETVPSCPSFPYNLGSVYVTACAYKNVALHRKRSQVRSLYTANRVQKPTPTSLAIFWQRSRAVTSTPLRWVPTMNWQYQSVWCTYSLTQTSFSLLVICSDGQQLTTWQLTKQFNY